MKTVTWVMGTSAAGKETFVRNATTNPQIAERLDWNDGPVVACPASLDFIHQYPEDPVQYKRAAILEQVPVLLEKAGVVLVKWQSVDTKARRPQVLLSELPDVSHGAIVLWPPQDERLERLQRKLWWEEYGSETWIRHQDATLASAIAQLPESFDITHLSSGQTEEYAPVNLADLSI